MVYDVPSSPPAHTCGTPRCLALPRATSDSRVVGIQRLDLGGKRRTAGIDTHLVAIDEAGAITSFVMGDWKTQSRGNVDIDGDQVMGRQHPEPIWNSAIRNMADGNSEIPLRPWSEKAKTKRKVLDLRDIWIGMSDCTAQAD